MSEEDLTRIMQTAVRIICDQLNDAELAVLNNVAQMDIDPHGRLFDYAAVSMLFTQDNGTRMHTETKRALAAVVLQRLRL